MNTSHRQVHEKLKRNEVFTKSFVVCQWICFKLLFIVFYIYMAFMLSLVECITFSSSLSMKEIKLLFTVNLILQVSDFLRLLMMSFKFFKCGLILLRYSSTTYSYWLIIVFFFFMLKEILNISRCSISYCFSFFF